MKVKFNGPKTIDGKHYPKGEHELDDKMGQHWFLKALVKDGAAKIVEEVSEAEAPSEVEAPTSQPQGKKKAK